MASSEDNTCAALDASLVPTSTKRPATALSKSAGDDRHFLMEITASHHHHASLHFPAEIISQCAGARTGAIPSLALRNTPTGELVNTDQSPVLAF